jgi:hypothetical protein
MKGTTRPFIQRRFIFQSYGSLKVLVFKEDHT